MNYFKNFFGISISFIVLFSILIGLNANSFAETPEDLATLIAGAKKEGRLMLYASGGTAQCELLTKRFREKYPFIKVAYIRTGKVKLLTRILTEYQFKRYEADAIQMSSIQLNILKKKGVIDKYFPPESGLLPEESQDPQGYIHRIYSSNMVLGYNTKLVSANDIPKTYEDLLDPKWKGKMALEINKVEWFATLLQLKGEGFFKKLARQEPSLRNGDTLSRQLLASGEFNILADTYLYGIEENRSMGAPIGWGGLEPIIRYYAAVGLPANAPHPNAGKLFINFLLTKDGQNAVNEYGRFPVRSDIKSKYSGLLDRHKLIETDLDIGEREKEINDLIRKYLKN